MTKMIFVSLPVTDLAASIAFYESLGFQQNLPFSDETSACMAWSDTIQAMLLTHAKWRSFTERPMAPVGTGKVMLSLSVDSRERVDLISAAAARHGGQADVNPVQDHGFMYARDLADPDDHLWGVFWMDPAALPSQGQAA